MTSPGVSRSDAHGSPLKRTSDAVRSAVRNTQPDKSHKRFMPKAQIDNLFDSARLIELYTYLFSTAEWRQRNAELQEPRQNFKSNASSEQSESEATEFIKTCARRTLDPPRTALLALLLHDRGTSCLETFVDWLGSQEDDVSFLTDNDLPFTQASVRTVFRDEEDQQYILEYQAIFTPFIFRELEHNVLKLAHHRQPFIGTPFRRKSGSYGTVFEVTIAAGHYEHYHDGSGSWEVSRENKTFALKTFSPSSVGSMSSADQAYKNEKKFLGGLRSNNNSNKMIQLDLGGIIVEDVHGRSVPSLLFELAICDLKDFFESREYAKNFSTSKGSLINNAVDILEALDFLHKNVKSLHLDIKPGNILVFRRPDNKHGILWKISDFNLSQKKVERKEDGHLELSHTDSYESTVPSVRPAGPYQAPEIQDVCTHATSQASRASDASDVWSMGCLLLKLLAFLHDGPDWVGNLDSRLSVTLRGYGKCKLFYVTSRSYEWLSQPQTLDCLSSAKITSQIGKITNEIRAMVHPRVIEWANETWVNASDKERVALTEGFELIFGRILLIDRDGRINAAEVAKELKKVKEAYETLDLPDDPSLLRPQIVTHSSICAAIRDPKSTEYHIAKLAQNSDSAPKQCPKCHAYLIHQLLQNKFYDALETHVRLLSSDDVNMRTPGSGDTPLSIACEGRGDPEALKLLFDHHKDTIQMPPYIYNRRKDMIPAAKTIIEQWYKGTPDFSLSAQRTQSTSSTRKPRSFFSKLLEGG